MPAGAVAPRVLQVAVRLVEVADPRAAGAVRLHRREEPDPTRRIDRLDLPADGGHGARTERDQQHDREKGGRQARHTGPRHPSVTNNHNSFHEEGQ